MALLLLFVWSMQGVAAKDEGLPDKDAFLRQVRARLRSDQAILRDYVYRRTVVERDHDGAGRVTATRTREYEVYPLPDEPEGHRLLVVVDGHPVPAADVERGRQEYRRKIDRARQRLRSESAADRRRREARAAQRASEERANVEDVVRLYAVDLAGRQVVNGIPCVMITFTPRREVDPKTRAGHILRSVAGRAWFSEREYELVRVDAEVFEPIRYGWGILAKIAPGARARIERQRTEAGTWLPRVYEYSGTGRVLLVKGVQRDVTVTFSDFRLVPPESATQQP